MSNPATGASNVRIAVIGAGIVGTAIAFELRRRGADVVLVDRGEPGGACSAGNSGAISPSSVTPLAMPGVLKSVPGMLLDRDGPLYLPLGYLPTALPWLLKFTASARPDIVAETARRLGDLHSGAVQMHEAMTRSLGVAELFLHRGHLHLYRDDTALAADATGWRMREQYGFRCERLDRAGIDALEPGVAPDYRVAMFMPDQATILNPKRYVQVMARAFADAGGVIVQADVRALRRDGVRWRLAGDASRAEGSPEVTRSDASRSLLGADAAFDHAIVAAGAWSRALLDPLDIRLALEAQRGYHVQFHGANDAVSRTVVLTDYKLFFTPMEEGLRVGGTVEIAGLKRPPDPRRSAQLERIARQVFPRLEGLESTPWMGHRPCMPDTMPVVGRTPGHDGLWLAVGHGHLGLTDSLPTAQRIADGILGRR